MSPRLRTVLAAALTALVAGGALASCRALSKDEVEARLLALPKNAALREVGLQRRAVTLRLDGAEVAAEVTFLRTGGAPSAAGARPVVVLVHGTPGSLFTWTDVVLGKDGARGLAEDFDVVALDVVGHGTTRTEVRPVTFQTCADWIAGAIHGLGLGPVHLVGQSYGGEFCWRVAADHPDLVRTLTLIDSSGWTRPDDGWLPEEVAMREMSLAPIGWFFSTAEKVRGALQPHFPFPVTEDQVAECLALCRNPDNWKSMVDLARDENGTRSGDLARIAAPTLLLWGEDDIAFPPARDAARFASAIPRAELHVLPGCGHYPQETKPAEVAARLRAFIETHR